MEVINIKKKLELFTDHFNPRVAAELNGQQVRLVKFQGDFVWHSHENEDELFLVVKGKFTMDFRDRSVEVAEGEMIVVPKGTEHRPRANEEVHIMLFEPASTVNTGHTKSELTRDRLEKI